MFREAYRRVLPMLPENINSVVGAMIPEEILPMTPQHSGAMVMYALCVRRLRSMGLWDMEAGR